MYTSKTCLSVALTMQSVAGNGAQDCTNSFQFNYNSKKTEKLFQITPGGSFFQVSIETDRASVCTSHWRISIQFLSFSSSFQWKSYQIIGFWPNLRVWRP